MYIPQIDHYILIGFSSCAILCQPFFLPSPLGIPKPSQAEHDKQKLVPHGGDGGDSGRVESEFVAVTKQR